VDVEVLQYQIEVCHVGLHLRGSVDAKGLQRQLKHGRQHDHAAHMQLPEQQPHAALLHPCRQVWRAGRAGAQPRLVKEKKV